MTHCFNNFILSFSYLIKKIIVNTIIIKLIGEIISTWYSFNFRFVFFKFVFVKTSWMKSNSGIILFRKLYKDIKNILFHMNMMVRIKVSGTDAIINSVINLLFPF